MEAGLCGPGLPHRCAPRNDGWKGFRAEAAESAEAISLRPLREPNQIPVPVTKSLRQAQAERNRCSPTPLRLSLSKPGVVHAETQSRKGGAEVQGLAAARPFSGAFTAREEWQAAEPQAQPLRAFPLCSAPLREPIRVGAAGRAPGGMRLSRRPGLLRRCAPRNDGFRAESAEAAEAISLRPLRSLREPNQVRWFQLKRAFDKLRRSGKDVHPTPLRLSLSKPGVAKHPSTSSG